MKNIPFVTWMLGWPIFGVEESEYIHLHGEAFDGMMAVLMIVIWIAVGGLLYVKPKRKR